jgi:hypothetical protein
MATGPYGVERDGSFWSGLTRYSAAGKILGTLDILRVGMSFGSFAADSDGNFYVIEGRSASNGACVFSGSANLDEYAAGHYGHGLLMRTINLGSAVCSYRSLAVDASGRVLVSEESTPGGDQAARIKEFSATATGRAQPIRDIAAPCPDAEDLQTDSSGNIYAVAICSSTAGYAIEYKPNASTPETLLSGHTVYGLAVSSDVMYALMLRGSSYSLQRFRAEDGRLLSDVYGPQTGLDESSEMPVGIAAVP